MKCDNKNVPSYLHWNNRIVFHTDAFLNYHKLYRLKAQNNPIEIPEQWANAVSCRWSKIIKKKHITIEPPKAHYNDYDYVFLQEIINYKKTGILENQQHQYAGKHVLTCVMHHDPLDCDFSHCEILIRHQIFKGDMEKAVFDQVYTHEQWQEKTALLNKEGGKFFKGLKKAFRLDMIKLISRPSAANTFWEDLRAYCKQLKPNTEINSLFKLD
jgi:hypothetical protein